MGAGLGMACLPRFLVDREQTAVWPRPDGPERQVGGAITRRARHPRVKASKAFRRSLRHCGPRCAQHQSSGLMKRSRRGRSRSGGAQDHGPTSLFALPGRADDACYFR